MALGGAAVFGGETSTPVAAARVIRIALVDTGVKAAWRDELNRVLRENLCAAIECRATDGATVRAELMNSRAAAERLARGTCDAVVIVGPERPRAFQRTNQPMLAVSFGAERNFEPAYLIVAGSDLRVERCLHEGFPAAVAIATPAKTSALPANTFTAPRVQGSVASHAATTER